MTTGLRWLIVGGAGAVHAAAWAVLAANAITLRRTRREPAAGGTVPSVSVIIPARNEAPRIGALLASLATQDHEHFEVIVYDDASDDKTGEVARAAALPNLRIIRGEGPPEGWVGKVHALVQATRDARGEVFVFLDADTKLRRRDALRRLVARHLAAEARSERGAVVSGLPAIRGGGLLLVSLVPFALHVGLPTALIPRLKQARVAALNGQCWVIAADAYRREAPHAAMPGEVLEDVRIGRLLKQRGMLIRLEDLSEDVEVAMYASTAEAWRGFRKNVYLLQGGSAGSFAGMLGLFTLAFVAGPMASKPLLVSAWAMKAVSDRLAGLPALLAALAPVSLLAGALLSIDSALSHWRGRPTWKGRPVPRRAK